MVINSHFVSRYLLLKFSLFLSSGVNRSTSSGPMEVSAHAWNEVPGDGFYKIVLLVCTTTGNLIKITKYFRNQEPIIHEGSSLLGVTFDQARDYSLMLGGAYRVSFRCVACGVIHDCGSEAFKHVPECKAFQEKQIVRPDPKELSTRNPYFVGCLSTATSSNNGDDGPSERKKSKQGARLLV